MRSQIGRSICIAFYMFLTNIQPDDKPLGSKHVAIKTTNKVVITDFAPSNVRKHKGMSKSKRNYYILFRS